MTKTPRPSLPPDWKTWPLARSYGQMGKGGESYLIELRRHPHTGVTVRACFRLDDRTGPPQPVTPEKD